MTKTVFLILLLSFLTMIVLALVIYLIWQRRTGPEVQSKLSDRDLLLRLSREPDGLLTPERLAKTTQLSKGEARSRLMRLAMAGILDQGYNKRLVNHYTLREPITDEEQPSLSPAPFLTVDDLFLLFERYGFRPRDQDLIMATGLPLAMIRREMDYFAKEGVIDTIYFSAGYGKQSQRTYVLQEPYRSQPAAFLLRANRDNLELREILRNDNFIV
ncbi:hypothetical protein GGR28_001262 [Lewinella aquimaris]|uniref:Uncharacterized protein n=1 Tax=Neolewinella aquimaris TaxID=1835722 RepID=A0A840EA10_9BACT|nr:hypothetical protein [Neolewinella aquimaris]MBB4078649.1 hypothetical protein [Neolewinella aquimaris]